MKPMMGAKEVKIIEDILSGYDNYGVVHDWGCGTKPIKNYFYDWYETEGWYKYLVDRSVNFCKGPTIDVGCGDGLLVSKLKESGVEALGIDPDPYAIELCRERGLTVAEKSVYEIEGGWDYLTCLNVIEHLDKPEAIKWMIREKIKKGAIITTIDYQGGELGEDHKFEWTYEQMMEFFKEFNPKGFRYKDTEWIGVEIKL